MASNYGNTVNHWRAYCDWTVVTNNDLYYAIRIDAAGFQSQAWGFSMGNVSTSVAATGQTTQSGSGSVYSATGATVKNAIVSSKTFTWTKGTSAATKTVTVTTTNSSGYMNGTSTLTFNVTVPVKTNHKVTFNANGGTGAPAAQTKWYGSILTLSGTRPTRTDYNFIGWGASASSTTPSYQPGSKYGNDADIILYAIWELAHIRPAITGLSATRCTASGTADDEGTRAKVSFAWETFDGASVSSIAVSTKPATSSTWTDQQVTASGTSGNVAVVLTAEIGVEYSYDVRIVVTDSMGTSTTATSFVSQSYYLMDFHAGGDGLAIGKAATGNGFEVAMDTTFSETTNLTGLVPRIAKVRQVGNRNYGVAYDEAKHQIMLLGGSEAPQSGSSYNVSYGVKLAGTLAVIVSGGDDVGGNNAVIVADSYSETGFTARRLGSLTTAWRFNWIAVGWVEV